jgi:hypothetical protein
VADVARSDLEKLVLEARRRANRRVLVGAVAVSLVPASAVALAWRLAVVLAGGPTGLQGELTALVLGLVAGLVLYRRRRLGREEAALLLDRRAGTQERCVTGVRKGGRVAVDALSRLDRTVVRDALAFRPPRSVLAVLLAGGAVAALHLLPGIGAAPVGSGRATSEAILRGVGGGGAPGSREADAPRAPGSGGEEERERVLRLIHEAEAPLDAGATAEQLRAARRAIENGDRQAARTALRKAMATAPAEDGGAPDDAARRIARALDAAGGAATGRRSNDPSGRVAWGEDSDLVRRYLLMLHE